MTDLDTYKQVSTQRWNVINMKSVSMRCNVITQGLREEILAWQGSIKKTGVASDWMVVVVEAPDSKKVNKFPLRTTVLEKLKQEVNFIRHLKAVIGYCARLAGKPQTDVWLL